MVEATRRSNGCGQPLPNLQYRSLHSKLSADLCTTSRSCGYILDLCSSPGSGPRLMPPERCLVGPLLSRGSQLSRGLLRARNEGAGRVNHVYCLGG